VTTPVPHGHACHPVRPRSHSPRRALGCCRPRATTSVHRSVRECDLWLVPPFDDAHEPEGLRVRGWWLSKPTCTRPADAHASACRAEPLRWGDSRRGLARHWTEDSGLPPRRVHPPRGLCRFRPRPRLAARPSASRPAHAHISGARKGPRVWTPPRFGAPLS